MTKTILNLKKRLIVAGTFSAVLLTVFSCGKKEIYNSRLQEDIQRKRSLELENSYVSNNYQEEASSTQNTVSEETPISDATPILESTGVISKNSTVSENLKSELIEKDANTSITKENVAKLNKAKDVKGVKSIKKSSLIKKIQAINQNIKIGLILLLAGILVSILGGIFGLIGAILAIIGIVFLILGLLEM